VSVRSLLGSVGLAACLSVVWAATAGAEAEGPANPLLRKLLAKEPVTYLALGDSVTYGMSVRDAPSNRFPALFARALREQFDHPSLRLVCAGDPGVTVGGALKYVEGHLTGVSPDLVTIQYGGNDSRLGTDPQTFRSEYRDLVQLALGKTAADARRPCATTILCVPPLEDKFSDAEVSQAIFTTARKAALPVADFEAAMKRELPEFRGPFPWGDHPDDHAHAVMARALFATLAEELGLTRDLSVRLQRGTRLVSADTDTLGLSAEFTGPARSPVGLRLDCGGETFTAVGVVSDAGDGAAQFAVPRKPGAMVRTGTLRAWCSIRLDRTPEQPSRPVGAPSRPVGAPSPYDFEVAWLSVAPVLPLGDEHVLVLDKSHARLGGESVEDDADLSAKITARRLQDDLLLTVDVNDSKLSVDNASGPYDSDCVELYLDARPPQLQGAPYYSEGVALVFIVPAAGNPRVTWVAKKPLPPGWDGIAINSRWRTGGYVVEIRLPRAAQTTQAGAPPESLGFDVAIDDSDNGRFRETQLMWAGSTRNHIVPSEFGALDLREAPEMPSIRVTVH
jgi:lysophospholipase L1-like esterase